MTAGDAAYRSLTRPVIEVVRPVRRPMPDEPGLTSSRPRLTVAGGDRRQIDRWLRPASALQMATDVRSAAEQNAERPAAGSTADAPVPAGGSAPPPGVDLDDLTAKVIAAIDRRLIAHRERMGGR